MLWLGRHGPLGRFLWRWLRYYDERYEVFNHSSLRRAYDECVSGEHAEDAMRVACGPAVGCPTRRDVL